jgi:hypothetical protein
MSNCRFREFNAQKISPCLHWVWSTPLHPPFPCYFCSPLLGVHSPEVPRWVDWRRGPQSQDWWWVFTFRALTQAHGGIRLTSSKLTPIRSASAAVSSVKATDAEPHDFHGTLTYRLRPNKLLRLQPRLLDYIRILYFTNGQLDTTFFNISIAAFIQFEFWYCFRFFKSVYSTLERFSAQSA